MNPEYVGEMTPEEEAEWKVVDMQNEAKKSVNPQPKVGDLIIVHKTCGIFFQAGAKAVLTERDDFQWWACFRIPENRPCDYYDRHDAVWCVGDESKFTVIQRNRPTPLPDEAMAGEQEID